MEENTPALPDLITSDFYHVSWTPGVKKRMVTGGVKNESVFFIIFWRISFHAFGRFGNGFSIGI